MRRALRGLPGYVPFLPDIPPPTHRGAPRRCHLLSFQTAAFAETQAARHSHSSALPSISAEDAMTMLRLRSLAVRSAGSPLAHDGFWPCVVGHASPWPLTPPQPAPG